MAKRRALWSRTIDESGISVRLSERERRGTIYRDVRESTRDRKSLGHSDRTLAVEQAKALAKRLAELQYAGYGPLTLGQLAALYRQHKTALMTEKRKQTVESMLMLLERQIGRGQIVEDLTQDHLDSYSHARRSGAIVSPRHRTKEVGVGVGTVRNELQLLCALTAWAATFRQRGKSLISSDSLRGAKLPIEQNAKRPMATEERYGALLEIADKAEPTGRFRCVLVLARETGRRINAICSLNLSDVLTTKEQTGLSLGAAGLPIAWADVWPNGAIRWRSETDKKGFQSITPLSKTARVALDVYFARYPRIGDTPLFPGRGKERVWTESPVRKEIAGYWLARAEKFAKLPKLARGGYRPFRRLFASERRHLPAQDVAAAGGWRSLKVMQSAYQHADAAGVLSVIEQGRTAPETGDAGHTQGTAKSEETA
jgi:integrase